LLARRQTCKLASATSIRTLHLSRLLLLLRHSRCSNIPFLARLPLSSTMSTITEKSTLLLRITLSTDSCTDSEAPCSCRPCRHSCSCPTRASPGRRSMTRTPSPFRCHPRRRRRRHRPARFRGGESVRKERHKTPGNPRPLLLLARLPRPDGGGGRAAAAATTVRAAAAAAGGLGRTLAACAAAGPGSTAITAPTLACATAAGSSSGGPCRAAITENLNAPAWRSAGRGSGLAASGADTRAACASG